VALPDGRSASRAASRPEDVVPTLEALLLVPPPEAQAPPSESRSMPDQPTQDGQAMPARDIPEALRPSAPIRSGPDQPSRLRIELSIASAARVGDGVTSLGLGALALLDISEWLVGFEGRVDRYQFKDGGPSSAALELAALAGRRFPFGSVALDLVAGPGLALGGTSKTVVARSVNTATPTPLGDAPTMIQESSTGHAAVPRLLLNAHLAFGARSTLRGFVGVNAEIGPATGPTAHAAADGAQRLPAWTVGLVLGATVGTS
jgi:hypothetical protein